MHLSDTLVFGPLHPLLPRPVRVRLVALLVGLVGGLGILTLAGLVLVLGPAALIAVLLVPAPLAAVLWVLPGRPRQWASCGWTCFLSGSARALQQWFETRNAR